MLVIVYQTISAQSSAYSRRSTCTARGFWDTELKPTPPEHAVEGGAGDIQPG
jgi:hypothetical protein